MPLAGAIRRLLPQVAALGVVHTSLERNRIEMRLVYLATVTLHFSLPLDLALVLAVVLVSFVFVFFALLFDYYFALVLVCSHFYLFRDNCILSARSTLIHASTLSHIYTCRTHTITHRTQTGTHTP